MLIDMDLTLVPMNSLKRIQSAMLGVVSTTVSLSGKSVGVCGMVDAILASADPVKKVVELAEADPECLRAVLNASLLAFATMYEIQQQQAEIGRRADLN